MRQKPGAMAWGHLLVVPLAFVSSRAAANRSVARSGQAGTKVDRQLPEETPRVEDAGTTKRGPELRDVNRATDARRRLPNAILKLSAP